MNTPRTIGFRIDATKVAALDAIAKAMDRDRSYLLNEAIERYLSEQRRFAAMVQKGIKAADNGESVEDIEDDEIGREIGSWEAEELAE
jgi:predicted transcriptional regulator